MLGHLEGIEEFVAVVDAGSFSSAARKLGVSKAHVSQQVSRLEDRLGTRLLHRTTRRLSLTETGAPFAQRCRAILEELVSAEQEVSCLQQEVRGRIRISSPHLLGEVLLVPALVEFQRLYPKLEIDIELSSRKVQLIDENYDIAIQLGVRDDIRVVNKELASTHFHVVASPAYLEAHGCPKHPEELKQHQCLLFSDHGYSKPWKFKSASETLNVKIESGWRSNSGHLLRAGAKQGLGLAYLPDYYLDRELSEGALVRVMPDWPSIDRKIVAIYQHKAHLSTKICVFLKHMSEYIEKHQLFIDFPLATGSVDQP